jgi:translocation and assembly module TamA
MRLTGRRAGLVVVTALLAAAPLSRASAFDFFGLFGAGAEEPVSPSPDAVSYAIEFAGLDDHPELAASLKDASNAWRLRREAPPSGEGLTRRLIADYPRLFDALQANGYFDGSVRMEVAGAPLGPDGAGEAQAAKAADALRGRALAPVRATIEAGPRYALRRVAVFDARTRAPIDRTLFSKRAFETGSDEAARAATLQALQTEWIDELRGKSYPLANIKNAEATVRHDARVVDATVTIDPGPRAGVGAVETRGAPGVDPAVIRSFIYLDEGEDYSPEKLAAVKKSVGRIEAVGGVKVEDGDKLDANGNLPLTVEVDERKRHAVGASAQYSTVDGPSLRAYWMDRNLFGGAERLRVDATAGLAPFSSGATFGGFSKLKFSDVIGGLKAGFVKPALGGTRNDLLVDAAVMREKTDYYQAEYANLTAQVRHRFSDAASVQGGVEVERGHWDDTFGGHDYSLLGLPASASYDTTDAPLAPTKGVRALLAATPFVNVLPNGVNMLLSKAQVSTYRALDDDNRYILAGRVAAGSIVGPAIRDVPASLRFFAGGGGSVRGFAYRSLSPADAAGNYVGGSSLFETSLEARVKLTDTIGVVPFVDSGAAFASAVPNFSTSMRTAVGVGLRYYTAIGPVRVDVATPLSPKPGEARVAFYIGVGEAF